VGKARGKITDAKTVLLLPGVGNGSFAETLSTPNKSVGSTFAVGMLKRGI
jgi:hypothetical protein